MSSERWRKAEELVHCALAVAPAERGAWLARACEGDDSMRVYVERLLACESPSHDFLETPAAALGVERLARGAEAADALAEGQHVGSYLVERELGQGGMGAVYLARRDDEEFRKYVAVKIVRRGMDTEDILRRFRNERQILAALDHPNIARLLDGGTTSDGLPYLVMEYVEGTPVTDYCDRHRLSISERLKLFRTICAAVQHAHQNLVVHRDLKPSNILITADGTPKLLDFGIAKILNPTLSSLPMERTRTELRVLTPAYASPEQVRGEKMTTVSDVYSLGVLLYELLAGHRPYRADGAPPHEMARVICQQEPARPSVAAARAEVVEREGEPDTTITPELVARERNAQPERLRRLLAGDLDNIVLMALRKEPQRRYVSAEQLSADIQRHLDGLPVGARKDTFSYRSAKFVKRHRGGVVAALLIVLALTAGLAATAWEARVARVERARADRRFNDVRKLAHSNLFELHDAIANLPGSTPARELLVKRALEYLDSLAEESGDDPSLQREIVSAYLKVGNVLGNPNNANLGDSAGAMQSYGKALAIDQRILAAKPADREAYRLFAVVNEKMSDVQAANGDLRGAVDSSSKSLSIFRNIAESHPSEAPAQISLAISHIKRGDVLGNPDFPNAGDREGAEQSYRASLVILERVGRDGADEPKTRRLRGLVNERLGTMLTTQGKIAEAAEAYRQSLAIRETLASENPADVDAVRDVAIAHEKIANVLEARGDFNAALESRRKSLEIFRGLVEADGQNVQARQSLALSYLYLGDLLTNAKASDRAEAQKSYRAALDVLQRVGGADAATSVKTQEMLTRARQRLSTGEKTAGK